MALELFEVNNFLKEKNKHVEILPVLFSKGKIHNCSKSFEPYNWNVGVGGMIKDF